MKRFTRRELAGIVGAGITLTAKAAAQTPAATPDWLQQARDSKRAAGADLAKFDLPMSTEPAFHFKA
jgi:hypothetical protein